MRMLRNSQLSTVDSQQTTVNSYPWPRNSGPLTVDRRLIYVLLLLVYLPTISIAQPDTLNKKRLALVGGGTAVVYTGMLVGLNQAWYVNYPRSSFHWINDNKGWNQVDKVGHAWTSYSYGLAGIEMMEWTGVSRKKAIWIGGLAGTLFQTPIEILDGFSEQWGASSGDLIANSLGSALLISQALVWDEQRVQLKFSYWPGDYAKLRPAMLGENPYSRVLKDYNAQTYWLSVNPWSFAKNSKWPAWLNVSVGYGSDGMLGSHENKWVDSQGMYQDYTHIARRRQMYLSLDLDLQRLPVKNAFLKKVLRVANCLKIPAPTLVYNEGGNWQFYPLYY